MAESVAGVKPPHCPSAPPEWEGAAAIGIVTGTVGDPRIEFLPAPQPVSDELLALSAPVTPAEVFRFAAPCAESDCAHFAFGECRLVKRIVEALPPATEALPRCRIRSRCRWWRQEGRAACARCPQIVTSNFHSTEAFRYVVTGEHE